MKKQADQGMSAEIQGGNLNGIKNQSQSRIVRCMAELDGHHNQDGQHNGKALVRLQNKQSG